jgi:hypothetical protein
MNPTYDFTGQVALVTGGQLRDGAGHRPGLRRSGRCRGLADINDQTLGAATDELTAAGY